MYNKNESGTILQHLGGNHMASIGIPGLIIILVIALIIFGPKKLPQLGKAFGQTLKEFKKETKDVRAEIDEEFKLEEEEHQKSLAATKENK